MEETNTNQPIPTTQQAPDNNGGQSGNNSGQGKGSSIPDEVKGLNFGAFVFTFIWGIRNKTYLAFLVFLPIANLIMPFVLLIKGNEWAWQNTKWNSIESFKQSQRTWSIVAIVSFIFLAILGIGSVVVEYTNSITQL